MAPGAGAQAGSRRRRWFGGERVSGAIGVSITDEILILFATQGAAAYFGEPVSILEHGLQAAHFAREDGPNNTLIVAALLHDVGHLLGDAPADIADWHADAHHEDVGSAWLLRRFGPAVADPVRLHVAAKRYLCATTPSYRQMLSAASIVTLELQGGPMSADEVTVFRSERQWREAVRLRLWDDRGKVAGLVTARLPEYRDLIEIVAAERQP
jgi:[1-hydroxy-2-(trimethylamino)ethyl]phosphonate dioxygenase